MGLAIIIKLHLYREVPGRIWPVGCSSLSNELHHGDCLNRKINLHQFGALHLLTVNQRKPIIRKKNDRGAAWCFRTEKKGHQSSDRSCGES